MADQNDVSIVFMPEHLDEPLDPFVSEVLRRSSGCPVKVMRYGKIDGSDDSIKALLKPMGHDVEIDHLNPEDRRFEFMMNDVLSNLDGALRVDITFASAYHAAKANYHGLYGRLAVVYCMKTPNGFEEEVMNPVVIDYGRLDEDDILIVNAVASGCTSVIGVVEETGFSDKKVYRRLGDLAKRGYVDVGGNRKNRIYTMSGDQQSMFRMTTGY